MLNALMTYLTVLVVFTAVDLLWLGAFALNFYKREIGTLLLERPRIRVAFIFYALYSVGIVVLAVQPAIDSGQWHIALLLGAVFGTCAYGTYDLTNLSTLRRWPLHLSLIDMAWGTMMTTISALAGYFVGRLNLAGSI
jgi:uncharacterized membrane protein